MFCLILGLIKTWRILSISYIIKLLCCFHFMMPLFRLDVFTVLLNHLGLSDTKYSLSAFSLTFGKPPVYCRSLAPVLSYITTPLFFSFFAYDMILPSWRVSNKCLFFFWFFLSELNIFSTLSLCFPAEQYKHHWFPDRPCKGSGYRCIRINHKMDPLVWQAGQRIGLTIQQLYLLLPSELTLWVDPFEVSYRIGEDGSICVLYESQPGPGGMPATATTSSPSGNSGAVNPMVDSHISCKEELMVLGRTSPSKGYNMMTVSS